MFRSLLTSLPSLFTKSVRLKSYEVVTPHKVSPQISFDCLSVPLPPYAKSGIPPPLANQHEPEIKSPEAIAKMRTSCQLAKKILDNVADIVRVGVTTDEIDKFVHQMTISNNAVRHSHYIMVSFVFTLILLQSKSNLQLVIFYLLQNGTKTSVKNVH